MLVFVQNSSSWTRDCDKRLTRQISHIWFAKSHRQYCVVRDNTEFYKLGLFPDASFAGDVQKSKSTSADIRCILEKHSLLQVCLRKFYQLHAVWYCTTNTRAHHSIANGNHVQHYSSPSHLATYHYQSTLDSEICVANLTCRHGELPKHNSHLEYWRVLLGMCLPTSCDSEIPGSPACRENIVWQQQRDA